MNNKFNHVILGGTFDHFHLGHQKMLEKAFSIGSNVTIGITKKNLFSKKFLFNNIEDFFSRKKSVSEFLAKRNWLEKAKLLPIKDIYGTTLTDNTIDAIVVSKATFINAVLINKLRHRRGLTEMRIVVIDDVLAEDGKLLTSERIRLGQVDRAGKFYDLRFMIKDLKNKESLILPKYLREKLRIPLGKVFPDISSLLHYINIMESTIVVAVGDIIVKSLLEQGIEPDVKVIDFKTRRKVIDFKSKILNSKSQINPKSKVQNSKHLEHLDFENLGLFRTLDLEFRVLNKPGTINLKTAEILKQKIQNAVLKKEKSWLVIDGEEDLLTLPAILFAPLGSLVLYGQMDLGAVVVDVTEDKKQKVKSIIKKFI